MKTEIVKVQPERETEFLKEIEKLNKKGCKIEILSSSIEDTEVSKGVFDRKICYTLNFETSKIDGFDLIGKLDFKSVKGQVIVKSRPGFKIPSTVTHTKECEHCNSKRDRNDIYILTDGSSLKKVGRNCLASFLGIDPTNYLSKFSFLNEWTDKSSSLSGEFFYSRNEVLRISASVVSKLGYVSLKNSTDTKQSTSSIVNDLMNKPVKFELVQEWNRLHSDFDTDNSKFSEMVSDCLTWIDGQVETEYFRNIKVILNSGDNVSYSTLNYLISVMGCYIASLKKEEIKSGKKLNFEQTFSNNSFFGEVEKTYTETFKVYSVNSINTSYGMSLLTTLEKDGQMFTSFNVNFTEGSEATFKFKVTKHQEYNGRKQTTIKFMKK
jgi:hypothetical protein